MSVTTEFSLLSDQDVFLFNEGTHRQLYEKLGAHAVEVDGQAGVYFAVWAPNAESVFVIGDFNDWCPDRHRLYPRQNSGIWEGFIADAHEGARYKFRIHSRWNEHQVDKADPYAFYAEESPGTASIVRSLDYEWGDELWMYSRWKNNRPGAPISIYEMHLGSWNNVEGQSGQFANYRELAEPLTEHLDRNGFTHVEFLPVMEHPFYGSWGYQTTGYFAPTSRYGTPQDLMYLVDYLHRHGLGVILDWVPSHFPSDEHGLAYFDGTHLFEHADMRQAWHPDWNSYLFNYGRTEVREFLINSALYWLDKYHIDGLRVDAVASMLYLDYSRKEGEWIPNEFGGRENLEAIQFLRELNETIYDRDPGIISIAEESTAWPMVSRPLYVGGLGFGGKWDMGWMHDTLSYLQTDPVYRSYQHDQLTFRSVYANDENYVLPLSHDEVVHGKGSLVNKMPGDDWQKLANLRLLYGYMWSQPGKKLLFMGGEFGQWREWNHDRKLDWDLLDQPQHANLQRWIGDLNHCYREEPALHENDWSPDGFQWIINQDNEQSVLAYLRKADDPVHDILVIANFTPVPRHDYQVGVPSGGRWEELLNSDAQLYGGSDVGNFGAVAATENPSHGFRYSLRLQLPPLGVVFLRAERSAEK